MSQQIVDAVNVVSSLESAPDRLRAEIGQYFSIKDEGPGQGMLDNISFESGKISSVDITEVTYNNQTMIPTQRQVMQITGKEEVFRDQEQWNQYLNETISLGTDFIDHTFTLNIPTLSNTFSKNYHHPIYENSTKLEGPSSQLLNYNLLSYPHSSEAISRIGQIRTSFDIDRPGLESIMQNYESRLINYTGSATELSNKQRNVFIFNDTTSHVIEEDFPYVYKKTFINNQPAAAAFKHTMEDFRVIKNLFQSIKSDLSFVNRGFNLGNQSIDGKVFDATRLLTNTGLLSFSESFDEIFLLKEEDIGESDISERFVNQIRTVRFLSEFRNKLKNSTRNINKIFDCDQSETFVLGYKIEKFIDRDITRPIQTFYTTNSNLVDTQIKYGRKYIYRTKALIGIFGSSYSYSNLSISENEYLARLTVEVRPSFQILELDIDRDEVAFIDTPMFFPHVTLHGDKTKPIVNFLLQPRNFSIHDPSKMTEEAGPPVGNLLDSDQIINDLYSISKDRRISNEYFTGIYEIYRMDKPPKSIYDFSDSFLVSIDQSLDAGNLDDFRLPIENFDIDVAKFTDTIIPNKKYYYAFRSLTFHGTPSDLSPIIEVELLRDSDEYKIVSKHYKIKNNTNYSTKKKVKRLMRIVPNLDRLYFSTEETENLWELDSGNLVSAQSPADRKTFKIRVTSKHTGKKIDLNITFRINRDGSFFPANSSPI